MVLMSGAANPARLAITDHQRAEARTHVEFLRREREIPLRHLEQLQREQPQNSGLESIAAWINFSSSRLESVLPILSTQIYTSVDSVILELIQNADDAKYDHAQSTSCTPYITFTLFPDKVIVEYNEDGFTRDDVNRICDINNSNKGKDDIGEKGIGFKSVFMIASKVHIESREYSFSFKYREGDNTLQMFTPEYEAPKDHPNGCTRITLTLLEDQGIRSDAIRKFREVPTTLLLFLRHIKKLSIIEHLKDGTQSATCTSYEESGEQGVLRKNDGLQPEKKFLIFSKFFPNVPTTGEKRKNPEAEVKLAFPLTPINTPLIEMQQDVFARLPIGSTGVGLHFLVHSDFSTSANREAVDEKSRRNAALLDRIAELFQVAVNTFCNSPYPLLRHRWMEFLPDNSVSSTFWSSLRVKIESNLATTPFLRSGSGRPDLISNLRYVPEIFRGRLEEGSKPLFPDLPHNEKYLHPDYELQLPRLRVLGLKDLATEDMLVRVKIDAESTLCSTMRTTTDKMWHTHVALFLLSCKKDYPKEWEKVLAFPLIPLFPAGLHNWCSASKMEVYYPTVGNVSVPADLKMPLVTADAAMHPDRKRLFKELGVNEPPIDLIRQRIYGRNEPKNRLSLEESLEHLRFLWWTHPKDYKHDSKLRRVFIFNKNVELVLPLSSEIFFDSNDPFGVRELISSDSSLILHQKYLAAPSPTERPGHPSWRAWLRDFIGVQEYPRLASRGKPTQLSPTFERISKNCPDKVVGVLRAHWSKYKDQINEPIREKVSYIVVPFIRRDGTPAQGGLKDADLPIPALIKACELFAVDGSYPFLDLPSQNTDRDLTEWEFLTIFSVNKELNLDFYLGILHFFRNLEGDIVQERVFKLYLQIQCQCVQAESYQAAQMTVRTLFTKPQPKVFVPTTKAGSISWSIPEECLWDAPAYMQSKIPLLARYRSITDVTIPTEFFQETLLIQNTTPMDLLEELDFIRREESDVCYDNIKDIYVRLNAMRLADDSIGDDIRERFETAKLIWIQSDMSCWKSPSSCLWSSKAQLTDKLIVSGQYGRGGHKKEIKAFFVECLKVAEPTLKMLAEELQLLTRPFAGLVPAEKDICVRRIKIVMEAINSLPLDESCLVRENLRSSSIFPVRWEDGGLSLETAEREFSIRDRENYWEAFNKKVPMLELTLEEVNELGPFLRWMDLENRYLSNRVTERSEFSGTPEECSGNLTRDLRFRALALFRCAVHFKSPRTQKNDSSLFQLLSEAKVYQTSGISTYLDLSQTVNGKERIVTDLCSTSKLHIEQKVMKELRIFVPRDDKQRFLCYCKMLPERLMSEVFMEPSTFSHSKTDTNAARILAAVLNAPRDEQMLEDLLTEFGIRRMPDWFKNDSADLSAGLAGLEIASSSDDSNSSDDDSGPQTSVDSFPTSGSSSRSGTKNATSISSYPESTSSSLSASLSDWTVSGPITQLPHAVTQRPNRISRRSIPAESTLETRLESQDEYISLLGWLRDAARKSTIPIHGSSEMSSLANATEDHSDSDSSHPTTTTAFGTRALNQLRHDMKIGAAGELFVYELLKHLPPFPSGRTLNFNESNWPSSIRDYVRVHPTCRDEFPECKKKREQADIIFDDKDGDFTQYMIDMQYLEEARFKGAKPKYFIEVKSTLKGCKTKLYMSKGQYDRMHKIAAETDDVIKNVYLIFRVFYLDTQDIGLRVYSDPGELKFVEESYNATPKVESS